VSLIVVPSPGIITPALDPLTTHRQESWRVEVLDLQGRLVGELDTVTGGSLRSAIGDTLRHGGQLQVESDQEPPDWLSILLRIVYVLDTPAGEMSWSRGVYVPSSPRTHHYDGGWSADVELYSKLVILDGDHISHTWAVDAGQNPVEAARGVIERTAQGSEVMLTETTETLSAALTWDPDTSGLRIVNDLLAAANYFSLDVDGDGMFRADPYVRPQDRGIAWRFVDSADRIHVPEFDHEADGFDVPNEVVLIGQSDGETPALTAVALNDDPESPWSRPRRGRWITRTRSGVEATSLAVLDNMAARELAEASQVADTFEVRHLWVPQRLNDAALFEPPGKPAVRCVVQGWSENMFPSGGDPGVATTLRRVTT
jgi:hypothetical protein